MRAAAIAAVFAAGCSGGLAPGGPGLPGGPVPPPRGSTHATVAGTIDASGGSLSLPGFTMVLPAGAISAPIDFTLDSITDTAPGGTGAAFRISAPAGTQLALPMTLTWDTAVADTLTAADQDPTGYWLRVYQAVRDATSLSVQTKLIGDWSLVTLASSRDLHGPFRLDSLQDVVPFTATGDVTLQWIGDDAAFAYYLPQGDITIDLGASACTASGGATQAMPFSVAEIRNIPLPLQFRWGINGRWDLSCGGFVGTNFDTLGVTNIGCDRAYVGAYTIDATHLSGQYLIDCTARTPSGGKVVASWDLVPPSATPGTLPPPPAPWP